MQHTKSPPSLLPELKLLTICRKGGKVHIQTLCIPAGNAGGGPTCPCMFMMTTVLERLHTTKCSGFLGSRRMLLTVMSVPADVPRGLKVLVHSVVFMFHTCHHNTHVTHARASTTGFTGKGDEKRKRQSQTPRLDGPIRRSADDVVAVGGEGGLVHK